MAQTGEIKLANIEKEDLRSKLSKEQKSREELELELSDLRRQLETSKSTITRLRSELLEMSDSKRWFHLTLSLWCVHVWYECCCLSPFSIRTGRGIAFLHFSRNNEEAETDTMEQYMQLKQDYESISDDLETTKLQRSRLEEQVNA